MTESPDTARRRTGERGDEPFTTAAVEYVKRQAWVEATIYVDRHPIPFTMTFTRERWDQLASETASEEELARRVVDASPASRGDAKRRHRLLARWRRLTDRLMDGLA